MSKVRAWAAVAAVALAAPLLAQTGDLPAEVVIRDIAVVDVEAGRVLSARDIVVRGTRIDSMSPAGGVLPAAKTLIDGGGKFAIPGLIDAPVRLAAFSRGALQELLAAGVTAVGDVGTDPVQLDRWRRDLNTGRLYAPRIAEGCGPARNAGPAARTSPAAPGALHDELVRLVSSAGRTPAQALREVTLERARTWCLAGLATIAPGGPADLVVLAANPLADVRHTRRIDAVVFRGEVFTYAHLQMLRRGALPTPTPAP
jgi:imidazolonepropionase-like amidohydrolase